TPARPSGRARRRPSPGRCWTAHRRRTRGGAPSGAHGERSVTTWWRSCGSHTRDVRAGSATPPRAERLETPAEPDLVEACLRAIDEEARLVRVADLRVGLHRLLAALQVGQDLPLLEPGARLEVARLADLDRPLDEREGALPRGRVVRAREQVLGDVERARTDVPVHLAPVPGR